VYNYSLKLDFAEDDIPLLVRTLEHYAACLEATKRAIAEELKRKPGRQRRNCERSIQYQQQLPRQT
jgi:hypothetical protein